MIQVHEGNGISYELRIRQMLLREDMRRREAFKKRVIDGIKRKVVPEAKP